MLHSVQQDLAVHHVHIQMMCTLDEIAVQNLHQIAAAFFGGFAQCVGHNGEGVGNTVLAHGPVGDLGYRVQAGQRAAFIPAVHGVGAGGEGFARLAAVRGGAGLFAVHHVAGDGQGGQRVNGAPVQRVLFQLGREVGNDLHGDIVHPVIVIAVLGEVTLGDEIHRNAVFIADGLHLGKLDGGERVGGDGKTRHAEGGQALHQRIVEGHLAGFVGVFVMHEVDDVDGVHIQLGNVGEHLLVVCQYLGIVQHLVIILLDLGDDQQALLLVHAAVDGVQKALGKVGAGTEELHLLAYRHSGYAAGDAVVVAVHGAHNVVIFVLDGVGVNAHFGAVALEGVGEVLAPQNGQVGLGSGAQIGEGVEIAESVAGHQSAAVDAHAAQRFSDPGGIAAEQLVVLRGAQVAHQPQLDDELVDQLLRAGFVQRAVVQIPLDVNIQEGSGAAQAGGSAVVFLHTGEIGHVQALHSVMGGLSGLGDVTAVALGHQGHFLQGTDLHLHFFPQTDTLVGHGTVQSVQILFLLFNQKISAVQGDAAVVTHDAATAVSVGQTGEQAHGTGHPGAVGIGIEHTVIVGLAVGSEMSFDFGVQLVAVLLQSGFGHAHTAVQVYDALQGSVGLQADDHLIVPVNIAGSEVIDTGDGIGFHI